MLSISVISERYIKEVRKNLSVTTETYLSFHIVTDEGEIMRKVTPAGERTVEDAIQILWTVIDEAKMYLADPMLTSEEKRRWAKTLADTIGVLNKLLASQGEKQLGDEDLGSLLAKIPKPLQRTVVMRARIWRKKLS